MNRTDLNLADLLAQRHAAKMDAYWRDHADTLDEPFRSQLLDALDRFAERRAETQALEVTVASETTLKTPLTPAKRQMRRSAWYLDELSRSRCCNPI